MPIHDRAVGDPVIRKEPIGALGIRPILAGRWNAIPNTMRDHFQQTAKSLCQTLVGKLAVLCLRHNPWWRRGCTIRGCAREGFLFSHPQDSPQLSLFVHFIRDISFSLQYLWVIESFPGRIQSKTDFVSVSAPPAPTAEFHANYTVIFLGNTVAFTDLSTGTPTSWLWEFGDGNTSVSKNPSHAYAAAGDYTVTLTATNASGSDIESKTGYISVSSGGSVSIPISAGDDDAEENITGSSIGTMSRSSSGMDLGNQSGTEVYVGLRFQNVGVPQGAIISNARLKFKAKANDTGAITIHIGQEDEDNTLTFKGSKVNISSRNLTSAQVSFAPVDWTVDLFYNSADISTLVQEVVDRGGWTEGNAMTFVLWSDPGETNERVAYSINGGTPVLLEFDYSPR